MEMVPRVVAAIATVVGIVPRVVGIIPRVMETLDRVLETFNRVLEMAGFSLAAGRRQTLFTRRTRANTLPIQAICG
jgi:cytosine/uracil/thiamine/allantoin permease